MTTRAFALALLTLLLSPLTPNAAAQDIVPRDWLTLERVDGRGRRPFRPDVVYRAHLAASEESAAPVAGQELTGELDETASWKAAQASEDGRLDGRFGYAYTRVTSERARVVLARLSGAGTLFVDGRQHVGDVYGFGFGGVPIELRAGDTDLYVTGIRGGFTLKLEDVPEGLVRASWDETVPHLVRGEEPRGFVGLVLQNASTAPTGALEIRYGGEGFTEASFVTDGLPPLGVSQLALRLSGAVVEGPAGAEGESAKRRLSVHVRALGAEAQADAFLPLAWSDPGERATDERVRELSFELELDVREPGAKVLRTYLSEVDGSVQKYALVPPSAVGDGEAAPDWTGLVLSLHGASVEAWGQAACYRQRPDFWLVAPTNRRAYGFDWQDWGRRDAYDVLALALAESGVDPRQRFVTGHSMGGHGTWHLAANDLDGFAACAPSAAWQSFDTYGSRPEGARRALWHAADGASRTVDLIGNLAQLPVYVLHGTNDRTVPASEALEMMKLLSEAGGTFDAHFEGGAGHWWGNQCMDWPAIFDTFRGRSIPERPARLDFRSVSPAVDATHHWVRVEQVERQGVLFRVVADWNADERRAVVTTENVRWMAIERELDALTIDEAEVVLGARTAPIWLRRGADGWTLADGAPPAEEKRAARMGPLKRAFDQHFLLVVGTAGEPAENAALLELAHAHAAQWRYRGNGRARIVTDRDVLSGARMSCNLILYGNRDTNAAWSAVLGDDCPIDARRGSIAVLGESVGVEHEGDDLGCVFVRPRAGEADTLVGVFADSGVRGTRLGATLAPFVSGVGYPDFAFYDSRVLEAGDEGVIAAGFFENDWSVRTLDFEVGE